MNEHKTLQKAVNLVAQVFPGATFNWKGTGVATSIAPHTTLEVYIDSAEVASSRGNRGFVLWVADEHNETITMLSPNALNPDWNKVQEWLYRYKDSVLDAVGKTMKTCGAEFGYSFPSQPPTQRFDTLTDILDGSARLILVNGAAGIGKTTWVFRLVYDYLMETGRPIHALTGDMTASDYLDKFYELFPRALARALGFTTRTHGDIDILTRLKGLGSDLGMVLIDSPLFLLTQSLTEELKAWAMENDTHVIVTRQARRAPTGHVTEYEIEGVEPSVDVAVLLEKDESNIVPSAFMLKDRGGRDRISFKAPVRIEES